VNRPAIALIRVLYAFCALSLSPLHAHAAAADSAESVGWRGSAMLAGAGAEPLITRDGDHVVWHEAASMGRPPLIIGVVRRAMARAGDTDVRDSDVALRILSRHMLARGWALVRMGDRTLAAGDSSAADSCWALAGARMDAFQWPAIRRRHDLQLLRHGDAAALAVLEADDCCTQSDAVEDLRTWLVAQRAAGAGDTARAMTTLARRSIPVDSIETVLGWLGTLQARLGPEARIPLIGAAARLWPQRSRKIGVLPWLVDGIDALPPGRRRFEARLNVADGLRRMGRYADARESLAHARLPHAPEGTPFKGDTARADSTDQGRLFLARALVERGAAHPEAADRLLAEATLWTANARARDGARRAAAYADAVDARVDLAISNGRPGKARTILDHAASSADRRFQAAIVSMMMAEPREALGRLGADGMEEALFWRGMLLRSGYRATADSLLGLAANKGWFDYYPAMARERLEQRPPLAAPATAAPATSGPAIVRSLELMAWLGLGGDLGNTLEDLNAASSRNPFGLFGGDWLRAARVAYQSGHVTVGIKLAHKARYRRLPGDEADPVSIAPWLFPPAFDSLYAESGKRNGVDPALLQSVGWQESFFDAGAVSRAGALGVMQFMPATARVVARQIGEPAPPDSALLDAARSIRLAGHYLAGLLRQFDAAVPPALAAYNAGPGRARTWIARANGDTGPLFCEVIGFDETVNYVKNILATWQAYRWLAPRWE
jgi:soluble lytic murein transglycosylase-like protein